MKLQEKEESLDSPLFYFPLFFILVGLFRSGDYSAGDARGGASGGSVGDGVNHDGCTTVAEHGIGSFIHGYIGCDDADVGGAVRSNDQRKIRDIAGRRGAGIMTGVVRAEVRSGGFKIRSIAFGGLMDVHGMLTRGQVFDIEFDLDAGFGGGKRGGANGFSFGIF